MMNNNVISLQSVTKYFKLYPSPNHQIKEVFSPTRKIYHKKHHAANNLSLEIRKGEVLGIIGKNGSGKSTLLKLITGVLTPDMGSISVNGNISALLELGSGFNPTFTGLQNIYFYGAILGFDKAEMSARLPDIVDFADLGEYIEQPLKSYSSGMKARLAFAVSINVDPDILILDEVLAVGDVQFKRKCYTKMEEFFKGGKTVLYVSHDTNSINELCSRAIFMDAGKILKDSDPKSVCDAYNKYMYTIPASKGSNNYTQKPIAGSMDDDLIRNQDSTVTYSANFDPSIVPRSPDNYISDNTKIYDITLLDNSGHMVNILSENKRYIFSYKVKFDKSFSNVSFGIKISSEKGMMFLGCSNYMIDDTINVSEGDVYCATLEFECPLKHGVYYMNCGVSQHLEGEIIFLDRIVDAYSFKVNNNNNICNGLISMKERFYQEKI